jgi:hypothetical protein
MTNSLQTRTAARGGHEQDVFSKKWRRALIYLRRPGLTRSAKTAFNRRVRKQPIEITREETE